MSHPPPPRVSRRVLLLAAGAACLSGCGPQSSLGLIRDTTALAFKSRKDYPRSRQQVEALPYAQLGLRIGNGAPGILVLGDRTESDLQWVSANRIMVATRDGRIVRTVGLAVDLLQVRQQSPDLLKQYNFETQQLRGSESAASIDFGTHYSVPMVTRFAVEGSETIDILGERIDVLRVSEKIECDSLRWKATNTYWLSKRSALVWRSRQHIVPGQPPLEFEILKRPQI